MKKGRLIICLSSVVLLLWSCGKEGSAEPQDPGYDYFPTAIGTWVEYQVDSVWRDDGFNVLDSVSYRLLERIEEHYTDPAGRPALRILRYVKDSTDNWLVRDVWSAVLTETVAEKTEENVRRLKLSFPIREGRRWDMHAYGPEAELLVALRDVNDPWTVNGITFDRTAIVRSTVAPNLVETRNFEERYAKGVGMVEKYWEETTTNIIFPPPTPQNPDPAPIYEVRGFELNMVVVAYGVQ